MAYVLPEEDPKEIDENYLTQWPEEVRESLISNWRYIRTHYHRGRVVDQYIIRLEHGTEPEIILQITSVLYNLEYYSRFNVCFSFILRNKNSNEYRVFYASRNSMLFDCMESVESCDDIEYSIGRLNAMDLLTSIQSDLPSTKWQVHQVISMSVHVMKMSSNYIL